MWLVRSSLKSQELFGDGSRQVGFVPFRKRHRHFGISVTWMLSILTRPDLLEADLWPMWLCVAQLPGSRYPLHCYRRNLSSSSKKVVGLENGGGYSLNIW